MPAVIDPLPILRALADHDCRFVVVGSVARRLCGDDVEPRDLDIVVDADPANRSAVVAALTQLDATIDRRFGRRRIADTIDLPWAWGWRADTDHGSVDLITRFVDATDIHTHDAAATDISIDAARTIRCHPTEHHP